MKKMFLLAALAAPALALAQSPPATTTANAAPQPALLAPGVISAGGHEFNVTLTPDGNTLYFSRARINWSQITIMESRKDKRGNWGAPQVASFSGIYRDTDPFISPDGKRLYFISDRPGAGKAAGDYSIWFCDLKQGKWGEPQLLEGPINDLGAIYYPSIDENGYLYFSANQGRDSDLYRCRVEGNKASAPELLPFNSPQVRDLDPIISPKGNMLIFSSAGRGNTPGSDLYVSFKQGEGWSEPKALGANINTPGNEGQAGISPDARTLYFTTARPVEPAPRATRADARKVESELLSHENGLGNIYFVDISGLSPDTL